MIHTKIIVVGNEKGGSGKSTLLTHVAVSLLYAGQSVLCLDLDARQGTTGRFFENRGDFINRNNVDDNRMAQLPMPIYHPLYPASEDSRQVSESLDKSNFITAVNAHMGQVDFIIIDTPGNDTYLSRLAHSFADILLTPMNDSMIDLDVIANIDGETRAINSPSHYAEMVFQQKMERAKRTGDNRTMDWVVVRNRTRHVASRNQEMVGQILDQLSKRLAFRLGHGFSERMIFRELFLDGLTVLDMPNVGKQISMNLSHIAARTEIRKLLTELNLKDEGNGNMFANI